MSPMPPIGSKTIKLTIPVNWLYGIAGLAVALILGYIFVPNPTTWRPVLVFGAAVIAGAASLTTAINNVDQRAAAAEKADEQARATQAAADAQTQAARVRAALEWARWWNDPTQYHRKLAGRMVRDYIRDNPTLEKQMTFLREDLGRFTNYIDLLNIFEALEVAIDKQVVDDDTARRFFRTVVIQYWHATGPFIQKLRAEQTNARLYLEFEKLAKRWENA